VVKQDRRCGVAQPMRGDLPPPRALCKSHAATDLNARLENGAAEYPANTNCDPAKAIPPGARILLPLRGCTPRSAFGGLAYVLVRMIVDPRILKTAQVAAKHVSHIGGELLASKKPTPAA
jgi:hypothetical protein